MKKWIALLVLILTMLHILMVNAADLGVQIIGEQNKTGSEGASGLFSSIVNEAKEVKSAPLPSYSVFSHLPYDKVISDKEKVTYIYSNVSLESFDSFGVYLEKLNYSVWDLDVTGTTYILEIGENRGETDPFVVKYDTSTLKLEMIYPASATIQPFAFLNTMAYSVKAEKVYTESTTDHFGNTYAYSIGVDSGSISIPTNGMYTKFTGITAYPGERAYDSYRTSASFIIYGDGKKLYGTPDIDVGTYPINFTVNIEDCKVIEIVWSCKGANLWSNWCFEASIYNGLFY